MANARRSRMVVLGALGSAFITSSMGINAAEGRRIEEVVITAERQESTISDTSISISAFTSETLQNLGIRNAEDLQNMIPAAVIQPYDMAVRGVGRNFRNLGGDPGIATYQNGVYSEDFGIASSEGGLFDIERVEVLRGPQGTLYGRNAIGGAVNFINSKPTEEFEGLARVIAGNNGLRSIKAHLHSEDFVRVRIGIGRPPSADRGADYVLKRPGKAERETLAVVCERAADAVEAILVDGPDAAMASFNIRT